MAELTEEIKDRLLASFSDTSRKDLERSAAYNILDELYRNSSISKAEMDLYKSKYAKLHEMVIQTSAKDFVPFIWAQVRKRAELRVPSEAAEPTADAREDQTGEDHLGVPGGASFLASRQAACAALEEKTAKTQKRHRGRREVSLNLT